VKLLVDIGNSDIKWAPYRQALEPGGVIRLAPSPGESLKPVWGKLEKPQGVYVSNVAGDAVAEEITRYCLDNWSVEPVFLTVSRECNGLVNAYADAGQLGIDRWLAMVAAWSHCQTGVCVVDCGSAVTLDIVQAGGRHLGGYLLPGAWLMQEALITNTAGIRVRSGPPSGSEPGVSTETCLRNGTYLAVAALIDRVVYDCRRRYGDDFPCLVTGGGADLVMDMLSVSFDHDPDLVLKGVAIAAGADR
jgi:type III pantothenate kinase